MAGISAWVGGVAAAVITPLLMGWLSRGDRPGRSQGDFKVVEYGAGYRALGLIGTLFFLALSGLAWRFPGKTDPANLKWAIAVFLFFALFGFASHTLFSLFCLFFSFFCLFFALFGYGGYLFGVFHQNSPDIIQG